jgi:membrane protein implicated in regulation of membrane protease activity
MGENDKPSLRVVLKYILLQIPSLIVFALILFLVRQWLVVSYHLLWVLIGVWVGKDIILFPFLWRYYDSRHSPDHFQMVGRKGLALTRLNPDGYVQIKGERWQAAISNDETPIEKDERIRVETINGLKLQVTRLPVKGALK